MTKKKGGNSQVFSIRRFLLRARLHENQQNNRTNDIESGPSSRQRHDNNVAEPKQQQQQQHHQHQQQQQQQQQQQNNNAQFQIHNDSSPNCIPKRSDSINSYEPNVNNEYPPATSSINESLKLDFCDICYQNENNSPDFFYYLDVCGHRFCKSCLVRYLQNEINESRTDVACPQCSAAIHPNDIGHLLKDFPSFISKYEDFMVRRYLVSDPDSRWCPAPDCGYAVIATGCASCPQIKCERPECGVSFCYHCKAEWHPDQTCDAARTSRQKVVSASSVNFSQDLLLRRDEIKPCPRCQVLIVKMNDGSCNHMVCSVCGAEFCWLCMKEVSDLHYLSPSGCTFWGKKPWSKKKKIIWQIGTLIGAPVGIALLAGIAIPSMVIGIPVWVGRKLFDRYRESSRRKRNISVTLGVTASIIVSPLLAGLAIAIGVPILLFYVYGVVPISLCRAGCGANSSASSTNGDYNLDLGAAEENRTQYDNSNGSVDALSRLEDWRIGEASIGDVSLSATSGSALGGILNSSEIFNTQLCASNKGESTVALAGSVANQKIGSVGGGGSSSGVGAGNSDNFSAGSTSILTLNSNKSVSCSVST